MVEKIINLVSQGVTHVGFSDESSHNTGRYRSIALVSLPISTLNNLRPELLQLLKESNIKEFAWKKLKDAKYRFGAEKLIKTAIKYLCSKNLRIDVLIWDTHDSRHSMPGRDDIQNLQRMYYHLLKNVLCARWPDGSRWALYPDEQDSIKWHNLDYHLKNKSLKFEHSDLFDIENLPVTEFEIYIVKEFGILDLKTVKSSEEVLVQLADLFAGMAVYSRESFGLYNKWQDKNLAQETLFPDDRKFSDSDSERWRVIDLLKTECDKIKIGVSLSEKGCHGLKTFSPKNPLNFWWYQPQTEMDKAPLKNR